MIGDPAVFAIEWQETWANEARQGMIGHFCFWISGARLGDGDEEISLSMSAHWLRGFLSHAHERQLPFLEGSSKEDVLAYIFDSHHNWELDSHLRRVFYLQEVGGEAIRDKFKIVLLNDISLGKQRIIWEDCLASIISETWLPENTFDSIVERFLAACEIPVQLWELFQETRWEPVEFNGQMVYHKYKCQVRGWTEVRVRRLSHNPAFVQGLRVKSGKVDLEFEGQRTRDLIIWADTPLAESSCQVIGQQGVVLTIWNQWRLPGNAEPQGGTGNAGMLVSDVANVVTLSCSDGSGKPDFQDLVVRLEFLRGTPR
jgi:immunity protein 42 of polymorphic toxin system